ncbi:MAG TPA: hypothetical protein VGR26_18455 [Acidimicrobiales bacterium]|nr:hypothetical protein [Acidimicrobiales bacterium]
MAAISRSAQQLQLRRLLRGCEIVALAVADVHEVGALAGASG